MTKFEEYTKGETLRFKDISAEVFRDYEFVKGGQPYVMRILNPIALNVSASGGHRIITELDGSYYIPAGWVSIRWRNRADRPFFNF